MGLRGIGFCLEYGEGEELQDPQVGQLERKVVGYIEVDGLAPERQVGN